MKDVRSVFGAFGTEVMKRKVPICIGIGLASGLASVIFTGVGTVKATKLVEDRKKKEQKEKLTVSETVKTCWVCYIPAAACFALCLLGVIGGAKLGHDELLAVTASAAATERMLAEYKTEVHKVVGEDVEKEIRQNVAMENLKKPSKTKDSPIVTGTGSDKCYDPWSGRYFISSVLKMEASVNETNALMIEEGSASLNDFYYALGLDNSKSGDILGWMYRCPADLLKLVVTPAMDENGDLCYELGFNIDPKHGFDM